MPNMSTVRDALINLMEAKKANKAAADGMPLSAAPDDSGIGLSQAQENLAQARTAADVAQPVDQLEQRQLGRTRIGGGAETTHPDFDVNTAEEGIQGSLRQDPSRFPDSNIQKERMAVMEEDFLFAQKEFERLAGRPPSPEEMKDIGTLENLVGLLKDASGESRGKGIGKATIADDIDEIPF